MRRPISARLCPGCSAASATNFFGTKTSQCFEHSANRVWDVFVGSNQRENVSQPWRRLTDPRSLGCDVRQRVSEDGERRTTGESRCWSEYSVEPRVTGGAGDGLGEGAVVGHEVVLVDAEMRSCGEVEDVKVDRYAANAAAHFEWVDSVFEEVAKELRPGALLAVGGVPDARLAGSVVAAGSAGGICAGGKWVACGALVPIAAGQLSSWCGCDRVTRAQTYEPSIKASAALRTCWYWSSASRSTGRAPSSTRFLACSHWPTPRGVSESESRRTRSRSWASRS